MLDVDFFKAYNDRNGHPAGDIVLKEIARILIRNVRGTDIVARYGGEEFVVLLPETPLESAMTVAEKIRKTVNDHHFPFKDGNADDKLTVSIGVASYPDSRITSDQDLIETADRALYNAKRNGRNQVILFSGGEALPIRSAAHPTTAAPTRPT
jgi:diguanylate cyclase (GGDEF)-like protein